jgi:hypothetical protein
MDNLDLLPGEFLVLVEDSVKFQSVYPEVINYIGSFAFGLGNNGESLYLYDEDHLLVDSLTYDDSPPWPAEPDGNGPTLELTDPALDNGNAQNWRSSIFPGSPGESNIPDTTQSGVFDYTSEHDSFRLWPCYPNPFNNSTMISFFVPQTARVRLSIFNCLGRIIMNEERKFDAGLNHFRWDGSDDSGKMLGSGIYFVQIHCGTESAIQKLGLLR